MSGDLLGQAASALRETAVQATGDQTLARVLRDVRGRERRRRSVALAALPIALLVTSMGAWAATTGRLAAMTQRLWPEAVTELPPRASAHRAPLLAPEIVPLAPPDEQPAQSPSPAATAPAPARHAHAARVIAPAAPPVTPDELYQQAHDAHFGRGDFAAALALWDRYLALAPLPRLAVEARYNRAIALLRLGRRDDAARALRPFADGDYGSYRTSEARALLRAAPQSE
jgi:hypothetical protein